MNTDPVKTTLRCILLLSFLLSALPAGAVYSYDGIPLASDAQGTFRGEIYIDGGHGLSFPPYSQEFDVPDGTLRWARLYVGVWGGTENYKGWVLPEFNGQRLEQLQLAGVEDKNENVYCAGHGVYWVSYDVSNITKNGNNTVEVLTSSGEPGNKLDGRVYGAVLAAACEDSKAPLVSYQLLSGNVNLHGKGWSGTLANVNDQTDVNFISSQIPGSPEAATLSVVYLTGSRGLPDYLEFNGEMLGISPAYLAESYGGKAMDIANEVSFDASGEKGFSSSYFDIEHFDVLNYLQTDNTVSFVRGLDLDGDGEIGLQEGEDYLHPVLAALVLSSGSTASVLPDLYPEMEVPEQELVDEKSAEISFTINNPGGICEENCTVSFRVDGTEVLTSSALMEASGVYKSSFSWPAVEGEHLIELAVDPEAKIQESDEENNVCALNVSVKSKPDLSVSLEEPLKIEAQEETSSASLLFFSVLSLFGARRKKPLFLLLIAVFIIAAFSGCVDETQTVEKTTYSIPLKITNSGEASALDFDVNLYLDGESVTVLKIPELEGQTSMEDQIRVRTLKGEHTLSVKVDEHNDIVESDEDNNGFEESCYFN
ncbi:Cell surface protein [Methanosarcina siciliae T4/M]|uniref:Cell surface protein n=2 Tax=Methanosarcina siciliae TaxID=38027 RepID=A0A0E3PFI5_9EURY|nr:CARDB domain-containing protein [Methanosarcina siciliae]AKB29115.1 Cell surface protein [Methanosarcina siciliae T4/M]AKB32985.1 Cell surface protein [Methanosarcina siciliae HI350]